ncbi:hypothetical protein H0H87_004927 [Tephrocybe sp. NHM501043]|nr:hypothetical protein H0H87_004927 [Tephrocybe sp. NHM501043]
METLDIHGMDGNTEKVIIHGDYLYDLVKAVRELSPSSHDSHLYALETRVRALDALHGTSD